MQLIYDQLFLIFTSKEVPPEQLLHEHSSHHKRSNYKEGDSV